MNQIRYEMKAPMQCGGNWLAVVAVIRIGDQWPTSRKIGVQIGAQGPNRHPVAEAIC